MYARVVLGQAPESPTSKQFRALVNLERAGLIVDNDGAWLPTDVFRELLDRDATETPKGIDRFLERGRVAQWPSRAVDKDELIRWIMDRCLTDGESLGEKTLSERLRKFSDDPALIRRHCVDRDYIRRTPDGSQYYK